MTVELPNLDLVRLDLKDAILTITLDRAERRNAFNPVLHHSLAQAVDFACKCEEARVVVLTGAGSAFSVGGDMADTTTTIDEFAREGEWGRDIVYRLLDCDKPVICRLNGDAVGLGATIVLLCDIVLAADDARLGDPHVKMGLVAGDGGALLWPLHAGVMAAKYYLLTGDLLSASEAKDIGLITRVVPSPQLDAETDKLATKLAAGAPLAIKWTKRSINAAVSSAAHAFFEVSLAYEGITVVSEDHAEARKAFLEKRKPSFKGR